MCRKLIRTKYRISLNKDLSYVGKLPHEAIISYVPSENNKEILDEIKVIHLSNQDSENIIICETTLRRFLVGSIVEDTKIESKLSSYPPEIVVCNAKQLLGQSYDFLRSRHCQSFATQCYFGKKDSLYFRSASRLIALSIFIASVIVSATILYVGEHLSMIN
jgi:hypothetical protein